LHINVGVSGTYARSTGRKAKRYEQDLVVWFSNNVAIAAAH
jgi:hypothetical protein